MLAFTQSRPPPPHFPRSPGSRHVVCSANAVRNVAFLQRRLCKLPLYRHRPGLTRAICGHAEACCKTKRRPKKSSELSYFEIPQVVKFYSACGDSDGRSGGYRRRIGNAYSVSNTAQNGGADCCMQASRSSNKDHSSINLAGFAGRRACKSYVQARRFSRVATLESSVVGRLGPAPH